VVTEYYTHHAMVTISIETYQNCPKLIVYAMLKRGLVNFFF